MKILYFISFVVPSQQASLNEKRSRRKEKSSQQGSVPLSRLGIEEIEEERMGHTRKSKNRREWAREIASGRTRKTEQY